VLAGGCFWGVPGRVQHTAGVVNAVSGYAGGSKATADYNMVSTGSTGHAETVEIKPTGEDLLRQDPADLLLGGARPTQLNRQGPDLARNIARDLLPPGRAEEVAEAISPSSAPPKSTGSRS
jgi:peptide-methionine (S)-S-oxide reductase